VSSTLVAGTIDAWKVAGLVFVPGHLPHEWLPRLLPVTASVLVDLDGADAACVPGTTSGRILHAPDETPHPDCRCGFYAKPDRIAPTVGLDVPTVGLRVELTGRVVEHEDPWSQVGSVYRAQRQRVVAIEVPDVCDCGRTAEYLALRPCRRDVGDRVGAVTVAPVCSTHELFAGRVWDLADVASRCGVDVAWTSDYRRGFNLPATFVAVGAAASQAFSAALANFATVMRTTTEAVESMATAVRDCGLVPDPPDECRRDGETVLEWKARRDRAHAARLDALYGPQRPARHDTLGRRPSAPHTRTRARRRR
jgi:hypothetical protein